MAITVGILGESGDGKTTSIVVDKDGKFEIDNYGGLDPNSTIIINADAKMLSFPRTINAKAKWINGINVYNITEFKRKDAKVPTDDIFSMLTYINSKPKIKTVIIDTINGVMIDKEMREVRVNGYGKWMELALEIYEMITICNSFREDLIIYFMGHVALYTNTDGEESKCLVTNGRKLEKIHLETKLPLVLFTHVQHKAKGQNSYSFQTQKSRSTAKTPIGMFKSFEIPNSLRLVDDTIREFYGLED